VQVEEMVEVPVVLELASDLQSVIVHQHNLT
jgi:hypothetical protein